MQNTLQEYIPVQAVSQMLELLAHDKLSLKIKNERKTRHGDYKRLSNGTHQITVNNNLNCYRFLITLIHEIAHFETYQQFGPLVKPHGREWKYTFQRLMLPFLNPLIFPQQLLPLLAKHFKNPKASSDTDVKLALALKQFDAPNGKNLIFEIPRGTLFKIYNGRVFKKGNTRVKRIECVELKTGKVYLFNPNAEVELL
ncbi:MAG: sprT domain-containing protein [Flavobacteriaceae bacterium]|nr:sprT domain-containing protein [Flavobacteriaceae bacterium]